MGQVENLFNTIKECHESIAKIQASCDHKDWDIGYYSWVPGAIDIRRICKDCRAPLGIPPTPGEIGEFDDPLNVRGDEIGFGK